MGVPHLITALRPFAASVNLAEVSGVVIDGPGLAYHVWGICLVIQSRSGNPFEAFPSYEKLGEAVIRFLDELGAHGVCVKKILFDGLLPATKNNTRLSRLMGYTKKLNDYHQSWPQMIPSISRDAMLEQSDMKLFSVDAVPARLGRFPAAPFIVPAVIEVLLAIERYSGVVEVVPGEADAYCAQYLRISGGTVLTGDSDLLIHDLGGGSVTFFGDIEKVHYGNIEYFKSTQYKVGDIADRLLLPKSHGLKSLAFEMTLNAHGSFRELLQRAVKLTAVNCHANSYREFAAEYESHIDCKNSIDLTPSKSQIPALARALKIIDPRISEFLLQLPTFSRASGILEVQPMTSNATRRTVSVFLPFLLDCPIRTSAWEMSTSVRQLAYALANVALPIEEQVDVVAEYRRLQNGTRGKELSVPTVQIVLEECTNLIDLFRKIWDGITGLTADQFWRVLAVYQDLALNIGSTKNTLSVFTVGTPSRLTWDGIHSFAQVQGSYYSFRILKQILGVVISSDNFSLFPPVLYHLWSELESLPSIADLTSVIDFTQSVGRPIDEEIVYLASQILKIDLDVVRMEVIRKERGSKKQEGGSVKKNRVLEGRNSNNPFALLGMD